MSLAIVKKDNYIAVVVMEPSEMRYIDCDIDMGMRRNIPSLNSLKTLSREFLLELVTARLENGTAKGNKHQLASQLLDNWETLTRSFADQIGRTSVFDYVDASDDEDHSSHQSADDVEQTEPTAEVTVTGNEDDKWHRIHVLENMDYQIAGGDKVEFKIHTDEKKLFSVFFNPQITEVQVFKEAVTDIMNVPVNSLRFFEKESKKELESFRRLAEYSTDVILQLKLVGGGKTPSVAVKKEFLKTKHEAVTKLKANIDKTFKPEDEFNIADDLLNTTFVTFIKEVNEKFNELASLKSRCGDHFIAVGLKQVADDDLKVLEKLFSPRSKFGLGKNLTVEEKTVKCLELLFPALKELDLCSKKLQHTRQSILTSLFKMFAEEFSQFQDQVGTIFLDGSLFLRKVEDEIKRRENSNQSVINQEAVASNCVLQ